MSGMDRISDLVTDSKLETTLIRDVAIHTFCHFVRGRQRVVTKEHWARRKYLGKGGFGQVWLEECTLGKSEGNLRAVKTVHKQPGASNKINYNRELEALAKFSHSKYQAYFTKSFGWYETSEAICIAMEYLHHGDLHLYLENTKSVLPVEEARYITFQMLEALNVMHANDFAHRDIKPGNILIKSCPPDPWWVKLADFGISKRAEAGGGPSTIKGTRSFMAPELQGYGGHPSRGDKPLDFQAADVWALGEITFRMLYGDSAFPDPYTFALYCLRQCSCPSTKLNPVLGEAGIDFVTKLMAVEPSLRIRTIHALQHPWLSSFHSNSEDIDIIALSSLRVSSEQPAQVESHSALSSNVIEHASARWSTISTTRQVGDTMQPVQYSSESDAASTRNRTVKSERSEISPSPKGSTNVVENSAHQGYTPSSDNFVHRTEPASKDVVILETDDRPAEDLQRGELSISKESDNVDADSVSEKGGETRFVLMNPLLKSRAIEALLPEHGWRALFDSFGSKVQPEALSVVEALISLGYDFPCNKEEKPSIHFAAGHGLVALVTYLHTLGLEVKAKDREGRTAIHWAAFGGHIDMVNHLRSLGLDVKAKSIDGETAMYSAAFGGHIHMVDHLCSLGVNLKARINTGETSLHLAAYGGHIHMVNHLYSLGVNPKARINTGETALHWAASGGHIDMVNHLCSLGLDVKARNNHGQTTIHRASVKGHIDMIDHLCSIGVDVKTRDVYGRTAADVAEAEGQPKAARHMRAMKEFEKTSVRRSSAREFF